MRFFATERPLPVGWRARRVSMPVRNVGDVHLAANHFLLEDKKQETSLHLIFDYVLITHNSKKNTIILSLICIDLENYYYFEK